MQTDNKLLDDLARVGLGAPGEVRVGVHTGLGFARRTRSEEPAGQVIGAS